MDTLTKILHLDKDITSMTIPLLVNVPQLRRWLRKKKVYDPHSCERSPVKSGQRLLFHTFARCHFGYRLATQVQGKHLPGACIPRFNRGEVLKKYHSTRGVLPGRLSKLGLNRERFGVFDYPGRAPRRERSFHGSITSWVCTGSDNWVADTSRNSHGDVLAVSSSPLITETADWCSCRGERLRSR